jgi:hypothetical protein
MTRTLCLAAIVAVVVASATAHAQEGDEPEDDGEGQTAPMKIEAEKHFNLALKRYQEENYRGAADSLAKAHGIEPRKDILFAWAQAERLAGDCVKATVLYHRLRKEELPDQDRLGVLEGLERCGAFEEAEKAQEEADRKASEGSPWYSDWLGDTLLVSGIVGLGVGSSYWLISSSERDDAAAAFSYESHVVLEDNARKHRFISIAAFTAGGALITGAIVRYIMRDDGSSPGPAEGDAVTATGWIGDGAGGFAIGGRF